MVDINTNGNRNQAVQRISLVTAVTKEDIFKLLVSPRNRRHLHLHFIIIFLVLFTERACPQLAKANLGGPCLNNTAKHRFINEVADREEAEGPFPGEVYSSEADVLTTIV